MDHSRKSEVDVEHQRFPCCVVWTPIPLLSWMLPFIGHMGICMSSGVIRDFAGPYFVSEDQMAFGWPAKYWRLDVQRVQGGVSAWDDAVAEASDIYSGRMHNLLCDNCHSHVARALNLMQYGGSDSWNMVKLALLMMVHGRYVSCWGVVKTWLPFLVLVVCFLLTLWLGGSF